MRVIFQPSYFIESVMFPIIFREARATLGAKRPGGGWRRMFCARWQAIQCQLVRDALEGVRHMHHHNVLHRDLKPSNLFLFIEGGQSI